MDTSLVITGVVGLVALRSLGRTAQQLRGTRSGVSAPARCVRVHERDTATGSSGDRRSWYVFAFTAQSGEWVEFRNGGNKRFVEGARVTVRYDPADPHRTATLAGSPRAALAEGAVSLLLMGLVLLMFLTDFPENLFR
ncbi:DUF3592 domain-containing protein [Streptomyces sp. NBC_01257]|uniref:DUF3592 domain-containing protein n=1 Tax=Streptomyces sp. NBC_01257 TaxID=2903799 RepID=UPI002DDA3AD4|nr:DUF3592 domain-containing protein [Streptomyces sp. NBC_01257]WRZ65256.1 DUF3592 domain-containing protein [Streptomyces sp. NBC_01257]